ncbi:hypothetical protein DFH06DRAFT_1333329 [Mycena polygramma]|nr:hypothetical protein DFH06DRAFT_1333329 [Mycena polygramma]
MQTSPRRSRAPPLRMHDSADKPATLAKRLAHLVPPLHYPASTSAPRSGTSAGIVRAQAWERVAIAGAHRYVHDFDMTLPRCRLSARPRPRGRAFPSLPRALLDALADPVTALLCPVIFGGYNGPLRFDRPHDERRILGIEIASVCEMHVATPSNSHRPTLAPSQSSAAVLKPKLVAHTACIPAFFEVGITPELAHTSCYSQSPARAARRLTQTDARSVVLLLEAEERPKNKKKGLIVMPW